MTIYLNGKFACQHMTGVQRTATNLLRALDRLLAEQAEPDDEPWVLVCPPGAVVPPLRHVQVRVAGRAGWPLSLWEQVVLPWVARGSRLVNLAGSAPALACDQVCMLHDAAVYDRPQAYTRLFRTWYRWLFRHLSRRAQLLLTVSSFSRDRLTQRLGLQHQDLMVVPNGGDHLQQVVSDDSVLARFGLEEQAYTLVVGSANPNKNVAAVEAVFRRLPDDVNLRLVVVGGLNRRVFAQHDATPFQHQEGRILRLGPITDAELKALYRHAVTLVFPSLYEGFGLPALEAMSCGCPVIASRAGAIPEVCDDAALYFDPRSQDELHAALMRMLLDGHLRERLRSAGQRRALRFAWQDSAQALLNQLVDGRAVRPSRLAPVPVPVPVPAAGTRPAASAPAQGVEAVDLAA